MNSLSLVSINVQIYDLNNCYAPFVEKIVDILVNFKQRQIYKTFIYCRVNQEWHWRNTLFLIAK